MDEVAQFLNTWLGQVVFTLVVFLIAHIIARLTRMWLRRFLYNSTAILKTNPTNYFFLLNSVTVLIYILAIVIVLYSVPGGRSLALSLFAGAGVVAAIIGFASQQAFSNVISGIFIVIFKPFRVDDIVQVGKDYSGVVEDITLRHTVIRDFQNRRIIIPNAVMNNETVLNFSIRDQRIFRHVEVKVAMDADIDKAKGFLLELGAAHPLCLDTRTPEEVMAGMEKVMVRLVRFEDSAMVLRLWVWTRNPDDAFELHCALNEQIRKKFASEGIPMGLPHQTVSILGKPATESARIDMAGHDTLGT